MESIIIAFHLLAAIAITGLVLIQHGKGADMGASFGAGGSQTMFGAVGSGNALTKATTILAVVFFLTSLGLGILARQQADSGLADDSLIGNVEQLNEALSAEAETEPDIPVLEEQLQDDIPQLQVELLEQPQNEGDIPAVESEE